MKELCLFPKGDVAVPPSKSVSHRALICAGLSHGTSVVDKIVMSEDIRATLDCMRALGARYSICGRTVTLQGECVCEPSVLDAGESGTTLRFLIPIAALRADAIHFTGRGRLLSRPMAPYEHALAQHGVSLTISADKLTVKGPLSPGLYTLPGDVSSQFVSGLLLALPLLNGDSEIHVTPPLQSAPYVDLTLDVMRRFGVVVSREMPGRFLIQGGQRYAPQSFAVESDFSQAAFFLVAGALGCDCACVGLNADSKQGDRRILDILRRSGVDIRQTPGGDLKAHAASIAPQTVDVSDIPDLVPPLAALFTFGDGTSRLVNAARLRLKESDRLSAITSELTKLGADIHEQEDALIIRGSAKPLHGGEVDSLNDHRIAMMLATAAIRCQSPVRLSGGECVAKSYPDFWSDFEKSPREELFK